MLRTEFGASQHPVLRTHIWGYVMLGGATILGFSACWQLLAGHLDLILSETWVSWSLSYLTLPLHLMVTALCLCLVLSLADCWGCGFPRGKKWTLEESAWPLSFRECLGLWSQASGWIGPKPTSKWLFLLDWKWGTHFCPSPRCSSENSFSLPRRSPGSPWGQLCTEFSLQCLHQASWQLSRMYAGLHLVFPWSHILWDHPQLSGTSAVKHTEPIFSPDISIPLFSETVRGGSCLLYR